MKGNLLDFGCGSKPYESLFKVDNYIGLDFNGEGHCHHNESIDIFYDGKTIPFDNETFDSVFSTQVFEHIINIEAMIPELNRVMKTGAAMLLTCPFSYAEHEMPADYTRFTSQGIKNLLEKNGFQIISQSKLGNSFETIAHLWTSYFTVHITPHLKFAGKCIDAAHSLFCNSMAIFLSKVLPKGDELFLDNMVICRKVNIEDAKAAISQENKILIQDKPLVYPSEKYMDDNNIQRPKQFN